MSHRVGAESTAWLSSNAIPPVTEPELAPAGLVHAVDEDDHVACGIDVNDLTVFDQPWQRGFLDRCRDCSAAVNRE